MDMDHPRARATGLELARLSKREAKQKARPGLGDPSDNRDTYIITSPKPPFLLANKTKTENCKYIKLKTNH